MGFNKMKLMYWGKEAKECARACGPSPIEISGCDDPMVLVVSSYDVRIALLNEKVACPRCNAVNEFDVVRAVRHLVF